MIALAQLATLPKKHLAALLLLPTILTACQTTPTSEINERAAVQFYCDNSSPIRASRTDTALTRSQAAAANARYDTHCDENGKAKEITQ